MASCRDLKRQIENLAAFSPAGLPIPVRQHLAGCPACTAILARERLARGLVSAATEGVEPPAGFPQKVLTSLPRGRASSPVESDLWRPAWGLVPAFAATAAALLLVLQTTTASDPTGFLPTEALSTGESLVLESSPPGLDMVLSAVLDRGEP